MGGRWFEGAGRLRGLGGLGGWNGGRDGGDINRLLNRG